MPKRCYNVLKSLKENNVETELQSMILTQELKFNSKLCRQVNHFSESKASKQTNFNQHFGKENICKKRKMADGDENKIIRSNIGEDVQHLLNDQIRIREGAMKLISACSTLNQALEASKNLLTINARILGLMSALQKQKQECILQEYNRSRSFSAVSRSESCSGQIAISDIRVPVMWKDNVHFTGKTGDQSFYAFALIRCGNEVRDTPLYEVTSTDTDMYFDEPLVFEDLKADFKMELELYYTVITANERYGSKVPSKSTISVKKRTVQFNAPKFALAGHTQLSVDDIKQGVLSKDLLMGSKGASGVAVLGDASEFPAHPLELWGQFCYQLAAVPLCMREEISFGTCFVSNMDNEFIERYVVMHQCELCSWYDQISYSSKSSKPIDTIKLTQNTEIAKDCLTIHVKSQALQRSFRFLDESLCSKYLIILENCLLNLQVWKLACEDVMIIPQSKKNRISIPSKVSFYDQIVIETSSPDLNRSSSFASTSSYNKDTEVLENKILSVSGDSIQNITEIHNESILSNNSDSEKNDEVFATNGLTETLINSEIKNSITSDYSLSSLSDSSHVDRLSNVELSDKSSGIDTRIFTSECKEDSKDVNEIESKEDNESSSIVQVEISDPEKNSEINSNYFSSNSADNVPDSTASCIQESYGNNVGVTEFYNSDHPQNLTLENQNCIKDSELNVTDDLKDNCSYKNDQTDHLDYKNSNLKADSSLSNLSCNNIVSDHVGCHLSDATSNDVVKLDNSFTETPVLSEICGDHDHTASNNNEICDNIAFSKNEVCDNSMHSYGNKDIFNENISNDNKIKCESTNENLHISDTEIKLPCSDDNLKLDEENLKDEVNTCQSKENVTQSDQNHLKEMLIQCDVIDIFQSKEYTTQPPEIDSLEAEVNVIQSGVVDYFTSKENATQPPQIDICNSDKNSIQSDQMDSFLSKEILLQSTLVDGFQFKENTKSCDEINLTIENETKSEHINIFSSQGDKIVKSENNDNNTTCLSQFINERIDISSTDVKDVINGFNKLQENSTSCNSEAPLLNLLKIEPTSIENEISDSCPVTESSLETFHEKPVTEIVDCNKGSEC